MTTRKEATGGSALLLVGLLLTAMVVLGTSSSASAHAVLVSSSPKDGATMGEQPTRVSLTFNENVGSPAYVIVVAPNGRHAETGRARTIDYVVRQRTSPLDIAGQYSMSYRVVSSDGHPVEGTLHFTVRAGRTVQQTEPTQTTSFVHRHAAHITWGLAGIIAAGVILFWPWRTRHV